MVNRPGSWAWAAWDTMRATIGRPSALATLSRVITRAAAPSLIEDALAAVMVPSLEKAGFNVGIFSGMALPGCSSSVTVTVPFRPATSTGRDLGLEGAGLDRLERAAQALERIGVLLLARELIGLVAESSAKFPISLPGV